MDVLITNTYMAIIIYLSILLFLNPEITLGAADLTDNKIQLQSQHSYQKSKLVFIDYLSWQQEGEIKSGNERSNIIITNQGVCPGAQNSWVKDTYRSFFDGCFIIGSGNTGSEKNNITYNQSGISAFGIKASLGMGMFVSSAKAEIGLKIPFMYVHQSLTEPSGANIKKPDEVMMLGSLYSRWPFESWFIQTEFGKFLVKDLTLFSIGAGHEF
jgi:hypothetical protein